MPCHSVTFPGGRGFVCTGSSRRQRCACGAPAPLLCDWKVEGKRSGTCDRPICASCATSPAPGKDLCRDHAAAWRVHPARKAAPSC